MGDPPGLKVSYKEQQEPLGTEAGVTGPLSPMGSVLSPRGGGLSIPALAGWKAWWAYP